MLGLLFNGELPLWVPVFVIGRDVYLAIGGRGPAALPQTSRSTWSTSGKIATALLMFGFCDLLLGAPVVSGLGLVGASWLPGLNAEPAAVGIFFVYTAAPAHLSPHASTPRRGLR